MNAPVPAIRLPREVWNKIINDRLNYYAGRILPDSEELVDFFPFGTDLTANQQYNAFLAMTVDISDFVRLADPDYEQKVRQGLEDPPVSPGWKLKLMVPGEFTLAQKQFTRLMERFAEGGAA